MNITDNVPHAAGGLAAVIADLVCISFDVLEFRCARKTLTATLQTLAYLVGTTCYNLYLHPLARYTGPKLAAVSQVSQFQIYHMLG